MRELIFHKNKNILEKILVHFLPYFKDKSIEDFQIIDFQKVSLVKIGGEKQFIEDKNFSKSYLQAVFYSLFALNNQIFSHNNHQISIMLPINYFRFSGALGSSIGSGIELSIRLNDTNLDFSYDSFSLSKNEWVFLVKHIAHNQASVFIVGGTGSGKTTFSNLLINEIDDNEVLKVLGDIHDYIFKPSQKASQLFATTQQEYAKKFDLLMRINPDRILIPELSVNNVDLILRALNSGHRGFLLTLHSNSNEMAVAQSFRGNLALGGKQLDINEISKSLNENIDFFIFLHKNKDGKRVLQNIVINNPKALYDAYNQNVFSNFLPPLIKQKQL